MSANRGMEYVETSTLTLLSCDKMLMTMSLYFEDYVTLFSLVGSTVFNGIQAVDADQPGKQSTRCLNIVEIYFYFLSRVLYFY
jgi:hypothetical protein